MFIFDENSKNSDVVESTDIAYFSKTYERYPSGNIYLIYFLLRPCSEVRWRYKSEDIRDKVYENLKRFLEAKTVNSLNL